MSECKNHSRCVDEINRCSERICGERGVRLTPLRRKILQIVSAGHRPVKAYEILRTLSKSAKPPTVYRALDFLIENGLVHKLSSAASYSACFHPASGHKECFFTICSVCGDAAELCGDALSEAVHSAAARRSFKKTKAVLEVWGVCAACGETAK